MSDIKEKFLPFKQSKSIAKLGFDEECFAYFENQDENLVIFYSNLPLNEEQNKRPELYKSEIRNSSLPQWATATPFVLDAIDWFFDNFKLYGEVFMNDDLTFGFLISKPAFIQNIKGRIDFPIKYNFESREKARIACLDEMIHLVETKRHLDEGPKPVTELMKKLNLLNSERTMESFGQNEELHKTLSDEVKKESEKNKNHKH